MTIKQYKFSIFYCHCYTFLSEKCYMKNRIFNERNLLNSVVGMGSVGPQNFGVGDMGGVGSGFIKFWHGWCGSKKRHRFKCLAI